MLNADQIMSEETVESHIGVSNLYGGSATTKFLGLLLALFPNHYSITSDNYLIRIPTDLTMAYIWDQLCIDEMQALCKHINSLTGKETNPTILALMRLKDALGDITGISDAAKKHSVKQQAAAQANYGNYTQGGNFQNIGTLSAGGNYTLAGQGVYAGYAGYSVPQHITSSNSSPNKTP